MLSAQEIDTARHRIPLHELVGRDVRLQRKGKDFAAPCPFHNEKTPSFYVWDDHYHCFGCGAHGNAISYFMRTRNLDFPTAVRELANLPAAAAAAPQRPTPPERSAPAAERQGSDLVDAIMRQSGPISDRTPAHLYLWSRGLPTRQPGLLAHPSLYCHEIGKPLPALIAPITNSVGVVTAVQRIWLSDRLVIAADKAAVDSRAVLDVRKKTLGSMGNGAVRLAPAARRMGLAEGVETASAALAMFRISTWATCGAARMKSVWVPPDTQEVIIFGDNGDVGRKLADEAVEAHQSRGFPCQAVFPKPQYGDWNDQLRDDR